MSHPIVLKARPADSCAGVIRLTHKSDLTEAVEHLIAEQNSR